MRPQAFIAAYGTAYPPLIPNDKIVAHMANNLRNAGHSEGIVRKMMFLSKSSKIKSRPLFLRGYQDDTPRDGAQPEIYWPKADLANAEDKDLTAEERHALWKDVAPRLATAAAEVALKKWTGQRSDITHIVLTNTSGWSEPGIASYLVQSLGLPLTTQKAELNFNGCFCGMTCLRVARDIVRSGEEADRRVVLVVGVELASLHWCRAPDDSDLLASSLFSDGAAAFIVATEGTWRFKEAGASTLPNTSDLLGLAPFCPVGGVGSNGAYRMKLSPLVATAIADYFSKGAGKDELEAVMARNCGEAKPELAVHPGGPRILEALQDVLTETFGFQPTSLDRSFQTLHTYGNLGSTAILYVLNEVLSSTSSDHVVSMAFGPGVTCEWGAFERV